MSYNPLCKVQRSSRKKKKQSRKLSLCKIVVAKEQRQVKATLMKSSRPQAQLMPTSLSCHRRTKSQDKVSNQRVEKTFESGIFQIKSLCIFSSGVQQLSSWSPHPCHVIKEQQGPNVSTTPLRQWGFGQCLPFRWTTLGGKHYWHPIAVMGVVDMFGKAWLRSVIKKC